MTTVDPAVAESNAIDSYEFRVTRIRALRGPNYWRLAPVIACDVRLGKLEARGVDDPLVIDCAPAYLLQAGLPYSRSQLAIILDAEPGDAVPKRYQETENARRLVGIVADAVRRDGTVIVPAKEWELQDYARDLDCRVAIFATDDDVTWRDQKVASAVGLVRDREIWVERCGDPVSAGRLRDDASRPARRSRPRSGNT
jgi:hypothetical protein